MSQLRISGKKVYEWKRIGKFKESPLETFLRNDIYRSVQKNGKQNRICNECSPNIDKHLMVVWYRKCSSVKCNVDEYDENCPFR